MTYSGQGVCKAGLSKSEIARHAVIYDGTRTPLTLATEPGMIKKPISVNMAADQKLDPMSRLNFGKLYTVETNVEVMDVGMVSTSSLPDLLAYFYSTATEL